MTGAFYFSAAVAVIATVLTITRSNAVHGLLYLVVSLLAVAVVFYTLGAPFAAALEVIIYAGAIMVLFVFVVMMLNLSQSDEERRWIAPRAWIGPAALAALLAAELADLFATGRALGGARLIEPQRVGVVLLGPYLLAVELASMLLLAGLVAAYHLGRKIVTDPIAPRRPGEGG